MDCQGHLGSNSSTSQGTETPHRSLMQCWVDQGAVYKRRWALHSGAAVLGGSCTQPHFKTQRRQLSQRTILCDKSRAVMVLSYMKERRATCLRAVNTDTSQTDSNARQIPPSQACTEQAEQACMWNSWKPRSRPETLKAAAGQSKPSWPQLGEHNQSIGHGLPRAALGTASCSLSSAGTRSRGQTSWAP